MPALKDAQRQARPVWLFFRSFFHRSRQTIKGAQGREIKVGGLQNGFSPV